jgi:hypothetical protein
MQNDGMLQIGTTNVQVIKNHVITVATHNRNISKMEQA